MGAGLPGCVLILAGILAGVAGGGAGPTATGIATTIRLAGAPSDVQVGDGSVWAAVGGSNGGEVIRFSPSTNLVVASIRLPGLAVTDYSRLAIGREAVWLTSTRGLVVRIDPRTNRVVRMLHVDAPAVAVAIGAGSVWVETTGPLLRIDPRTNRVVARIGRIGTSAGPVATAGRFVWLINGSGQPSLLRLDSRSGRIATVIKQGPVAVDVASRAGAVWVAADQPSEALEIDASSGRIIRTVRLHLRAAGIAVTRKQIWLLECLCDGKHQRGSVTALNPRTGSPTVTAPAGHTPVSIAATASAAWVANFEDGAITKITPPR
jgi:DNA-binding beta-propeller fold protein YncE